MSTTIKDERSSTFSSSFSYDFSKKEFVENQAYISNLPALETQKVDKWISELGSGGRVSHGQHGRFNTQRFRPLIGIDVVRAKIQNMWAQVSEQESEAFTERHSILQAFRHAIPKIQQILRELVDEQNCRYETMADVVAGKDVDAVRELYNRYIESFRSTLTKYVTWRAEIYNIFPSKVYARSYAQIEEEYDRWSRRHPLTWSAHQSAQSLMNRPHKDCLRSLSEPYVGGRHFIRLRDVFFYMILTYESPSMSRAFIESAQGLLHGVTADHENLEKGLREVLYTCIQQTFAMGLCWLTQMYAFLIDHFQEHVMGVLLRPGKEFASLAIGHEKFLSYVRLEYHRTTRAMMRQAIEASKHARYAKMVYAASGICHFLQALVTTLPPTVNSNQSHEGSAGTGSDPSRLILGSERFLPENRNSENASYLPAVRNTTNELYAAQRGLLLNEIATYFNAYVAVELNQYDCIKIPNELKDRLARMSNQEISDMSQLDLNKCMGELEQLYIQLQDLENACEEIESASRSFDGKMPVDAVTLGSRTKSIQSEKRDQRHHELIKKLDTMETTKAVANHATEDLDAKYYDKYELELRKSSGEEETCRKYLLTLYRQHDEEDLKLGFLPPEDFDVNKVTEDAQESASDPSKSVMPTTQIPGSTTNDNLEMDNEDARSSTCSHNHC